VWQEVEIVLQENRTQEMQVKGQKNKMGLIEEMAKLIDDKEHQQYSKGFNDCLQYVIESIDRAMLNDTLMHMPSVTSLGVLKAMLKHPTLLDMP
jgi:hypothetical protein